MRYWIVTGLLWTSFASVAALAHTKDDEAACRPDVFRLCAGDIPDQNRIVACLGRKKSQLSLACFQVFDRNTNGRSSAPVRSDGQPERWGR